MKNIFIIFIILIVFFACGTVGYQYANRVGPGLSATPTSPGPEIGKQEQHNLVIAHVDQMDSRSPKLVSIWFISLFFMDDVPPTITFAQIYPSRSNTNLNQVLEQSFGLDDRGEPQPGFWKNISSLKISKEGYLLVDNTTVQQVLEWIHGPGYYISILAGSSDSPSDTSQLAMQTCTALSGLSSRQSAPFSWNALVPNHFRSDLHMELALSYWNRVTASTNARCEVVPAH